MRTILIDPNTRSFTEVAYNGDWRTIANHLGCDLFDVVALNIGDVYVDDEGLYVPNDFFVIEGRLLAGRGLLFGRADEEGDSTQTDVDILDLEKAVTFMTRQQAIKYAEDNGL